MNTPPTEDLIAGIDSFPGEYSALRAQAKKYLRNNSNIDSYGTLNIFHRPWGAPFNWGIMLYKGADSGWIGEFGQKSQKTIPSFYRARSYTYSENMGYFFGNDRMKSVRTNGKIIRNGQDLMNFLNDEVGEAEKMLEDN